MRVIEPRAIEDGGGLVKVTAGRLGRVNFNVFNFNFAKCIHHLLPPLCRILCFGQSCHETLNVRFRWHTVAMLK